MIYIYIFIYGINIANITSYPRFNNYDSYYNRLVLFCNTCDSRFNISDASFNISGFNRSGYFVIDLVYVLILPILVFIFLIFDLILLIIILIYPIFVLIFPILVLNRIN